MLLQDLLSSPRSMLCCATGRGPSPVLLTAGVTPYCASWGLSDGGAGDGEKG